MVRQGLVLCCGLMESYVGIFAWNVASTGHLHGLKAGYFFSRPSFIMSEILVSTSTVLAAISFMLLETTEKPRSNEPHGVLIWIGE